MVVVVLEAQGQTDMICQICGEDVKNVGRHAQIIHGYTPKEYYDKFLKKQGEGVCSVCGKPTKFYGVKIGYKKTCSRSCNMKKVVGNILKDPVKKSEWVRTVTRNIQTKKNH